MVDCDMCGKKGISPIKVKIEGTVMTVCSNCAKYGERLADPKTMVNNFNSNRPRFKKTNPDENKFITKDFARLVKEARERKGLKQEDVAKQLNEKESIIHKVESNHFKPSFRLARKLEHFYHIKLIEEYKTGLTKDVEESTERRDSTLTMEELVLNALKNKKK